MEAHNTTLATIFEWEVVNTFGLCLITNSNNGCSGYPHSQIVVCTLRTHCAIYGRTP